MILKDIIKSYFYTGKKPTQQQFAALIDACYNTPIFHNVIHVNYGLLHNDPASLAFKTYAAAVSWIQTNGTPALSNTWTIMLPSGHVAEDITVYANIRVELMAGTVVTGAVYSDVTFTGTEYFDTYIAGGTLNNLVVGAGKVLSIHSCTINGGVPTADVILLHKSVLLVPINLNGINVLKSNDTHYYTMSSVEKYKFNNAEIVGGFIDNAEFVGTSSVSGVQLNDVKVKSGQKLYAVNCSLLGNITVEDKAKINTAACYLADELILLKEAIWQNSGTAFNNANTGMFANDMQAAVAELRLYIDQQIAELSKLIK